MNSANGFDFNRFGDFVPRLCRTTFWQTQITPQHRFYLRRSYSQDASPYIADLKGILTCTDSEVAGTLHGEILEVRAARLNEIDLFSHCDNHSQQMYDLWEAILNDGPLTEFAEEPEGDILHLARLQLDKKHRGQGLGLKVCAAVLGNFSRTCAYAVMKPFPLQWVEKVNSAREEVLMRKDREKLIRYYRPLGFSRVSRLSDYWSRQLPRSFRIDGVIPPTLRQCPKNRFPNCVRELIDAE